MTFPFPLFQVIKLATLDFEVSLSSFVSSCDPHLPILPSTSSCPFFFFSNPLPTPVLYQLILDLVTSVCLCPPVSLSILTLVFVIQARSGFCHPLACPLHCLSS
uniref:Uncharacterized protein n=1 Tax=Hanusia phi TaxID=3032 RepID=A0A7S0EB41_9CRYP|mmetsp:Transcript_18417/g.41976  ORF Transcript_18417/g.41976 Transcript_18417/m.41976 type:complete len:104 (+) Transcript_18417:365-676(+)